MVEDLDEVRSDPKKVTLKIRDLDLLASEDEVKAEIKKTLQNKQANSELKVLNP